MAGRTVPRGGDDVWLLRAVRQLDFYPKTEQDVLRKSYGGGVASLAAVAFVAWLVYSESVAFVEPKTTTAIGVDQSPLDATMRINVDVTFHRIPCMQLHMDAVDDVGGTTLEMDKQVFKKGVLDTGEAYDRPANYCGPCYDADFVDDKGNKRCCNTCPELRKALLVFKGVKDFAPYAAKATVCHEGCRIAGYLQVPRRKGNVHVAAGTSMTQHHGTHEHHVHQLNMEELSTFNTSHTIHDVSFGKRYPGQVVPLFNVQNIELESLAQYTYYINVVSTTYERVSGSVTTTSQYSYTLHRRGHEHGSFSFPLPGVFFKYDIDALSVQITEVPREWGEFLVRLCGIIGGFWAVVGVCVRVGDALVALVGGTRERRNMLVSVSPSVGSRTDQCRGPHTADVDCPRVRAGA